MSESRTTAEHAGPNLNGDSFTGTSTDSSTLSHFLALSRNRKIRYADCMSDRLMERFEQFISHGEQLTDLTDEMAVLRQFVGDAISAYSAAHDLPSDTQEQQRKKLDSILFSQELVRNAIHRVESMAISIARIQSLRRGKLDLLVVNSLIASIIEAVDVGIADFGDQLRRSGLDPKLVADGISDRLMSAIDGTLPSDPNNAVVTAIDTKRSRITTDQIVQAMDSTIPVAS